MLFNTFHFAYFFAILFPLYWILPHRPQNLLLLAAGYYFYACWDPRFLALLVLSTVMDYGCGLAVDRIEDAREAQGVRGAEHGAEPRECSAISSTSTSSPRAFRRRWPRAGVNVAAGASERGPADRHLVLHVPVDELRHRRLPARTSSRRGTSSSSRRSSRSSRTWSPGRSCGRRRFCRRLPQPRQVRPPAVLPGGVPDLLGPDARRSSSPTTWPHDRQRPVRPVADDRRRPRAAGDLRLRLPDLLRLLGLHRRRPRDRQVPGLRARPELQPAVLRHQPAGFLEPLAHQPLDLAARLPVHPAGREPRRRGSSSTAT